MVATIGLTGLRPDPAQASKITSPPYDVIKPGTPLEKFLRNEPKSIFHIILGEQPKRAMERLASEGLLVEDDEPAYYVYEQTWPGGQRTGVFAAAKVSPYEEKQIIRHEKTFDDKVKGRIAMRRATGLHIGPVFTLTRAPIAKALDAAKESAPLYGFKSSFGGFSELEGIENKMWRVPEAGKIGGAIQAAIGTEPLYIADGHHRYHASLLNGQTHFLTYVTEDAVIQAYNRVINGVRPFADIMAELPLQSVDSFQTPDKHRFCIYTKEGCYELAAQHVPNDVVGRLDCAILERELYPKLGLTHDMIADLHHFDYYSESALDEMKAVVDRGDYDMAVALHPVSLGELMAVADAGLEDPDIVMPEKSTFFAPKILSGLFLYRTRRGESR
ncbi:MAG: DUF1015 domain-containing protein [Myxococcales bacterium]|nr:DUF1015 domain-containing protein [Myxococcales bacterium]MDH3484353.1 DUF1015 domain-containing protein [Myxococcales bacterium]